MDWRLFADAATPREGAPGALKRERVPDPGSGPRPVSQLRTWSGLYHRPHL